MQPTKYASRLDSDWIDCPGLGGEAHVCKKEEVLKFCLIEFRMKDTIMK